MYAYTFVCLCTCVYIYIYSALWSPAVSCNDVLCWSVEGRAAGLVSAMDLTTDLILSDSQAVGERE